MWCLGFLICGPLSAAFAAAQLPNQVEVGGLTVTAKVFTPAGWVEPAGEFPIIIYYSAGANGSSAVSLDLALAPSAVLLSATPAVSGSTLNWTVPPQSAGTKGKIVVQARAKSLGEDPQIVWKNLSSNLTVTANGQPPAQARTRGPKVTTLTTARYGDRPFPVVMVQYQDVKHCTAPGEPFPECVSNHTAERLDEAVNSKTSGTSLWQLYQNMSFGQLHPEGKVSPVPNAGTVAFDAGYPHKFSTLTPSGACTGNTVAAAWGTPAYANRIEDGWYLLPGTQGYYGSDKFGHGAGAQLTPAGGGLIAGIDDACGPTGKIVYDAASLADPDVDYNELDTDKDGVVDFFNLMFAGDGGNLSTTPSGLNNVWPHKSDLRAYFVDANGLTGYVSNDQLKSLLDEPLFYTDETRQTFTTTDTGLPVYVRVGPYNVNPESAVDHASVIAHEYGHSLGLPDFYSTGSRSTFGSWELMASDYSQFMTGFTRQELGWIVPRPLESGQITLRESKFDTGEIHWRQEDGTPYVLSGPGIHNADAYRLGLPTDLLIDEVPSGSRAFYSAQGNDFPCPPGQGHFLDVFLPDLQNYGDAAAIELSFKSLYEIEWDYDYGFVMVSTDAGESWQTLASTQGTTISSYNPNANGCMGTYDNGITGVSGAGSNDLANLNRIEGNYPEAVFIDDAFDLTAFAGETVILRFAYVTDPGLAKRGWFIDDLRISADGKTVWATDFEDFDDARLFPRNWVWASSSDAQNVDHAYYLELRDRIDFDLDGKGQSERGIPTWQPGVSMIYTDEGHGYGNTGVDNPPAQTPVDAAPQPLNNTPVLDDAAFTLSQPVFDGCTHVENYALDNGLTLPWMLPPALRFRVDDLRGLSPDGQTPATPALATLSVSVNPDCRFALSPPELLPPLEYEDPDTDGAFLLRWNRPQGAVGPDLVEQATSFAVLVNDDAESGLGQWVTSQEGLNNTPWEISSLKSNSGSQSFWGRNTEGVEPGAALLTLATPFLVPEVGSTDLSYYDLYVNESDDFVAVEVSDDGGTSWERVLQRARSELANDAAVIVAEEALSRTQINLDKFRGRELLLRFRIEASGDNRPGSTPMGWYVDDIRVETQNFQTLAKVDQAELRITGQPVGGYFYRVSTAYPAGDAGIKSEASNVVAVNVAQTQGGELPTASPTPAPGNGPLGRQRGGALELWLLLMLPLLRRRVRQGPASLWLSLRCRGRWTACGCRS